METYVLIKTLVVSAVPAFLFCVFRAVYLVWWRPKSLEKQFRQQGIRGTSYRPFNGDKKQIEMSHKEACFSPMSLTHQIAPRVRPFHHAMVQNYGKVSLSWVGTRPSLIVADPAVIKSILADNNGHFRKPPLNPLVNLLQLGVSTLEGDKWAKRRKLITPAFHLEKLKEMVPAFATSCCELIDRWKTLVSDQGSCELDVAPEFQALTGDVIARTAFGSSYQEGKRIFELQKEQAVLVLEAYYSFYMPGLSYIPTKKNKRRYDLDREIKATLRAIIQKKEQAMGSEEGEPGSKDLLGLLLKCKEEADSGLTIEDLIEECKLFYFAGQETSANWLTWTMIVLSMHPDWQDKARQEVLHICGKKTPDIDSINHLKIVSKTSFFFFPAPDTEIEGESLKSTFLLQ